MSERIVNISFPVKENILLSFKETKDEFTREILFLSALLLYRKRKLARVLTRTEANTKESLMARFRRACRGSL